MGFEIENVEDFLRLEREFYRLQKELYRERKRTGQINLETFRRMREIVDAHISFLDAKRKTQHLAESGALIGIPSATE